jgi:hypothetical protein
MSLGKSRRKPGFFIYGEFTSDGKKIASFGYRDKIEESMPG